MSSAVPLMGGKYSIDRCGTIINTATNKTVRGWVGNHGYREVSLRVDGKTVRALVHRLVLLTFVGVPAPGQEACHNDGDKSNNSLSNLRWDSRSENANDRYRHGYRMSRSARAKLSERHSGVPLSAEHRAKLSAAKIGNNNRLGGKSARGGDGKHA